MNPNGKASNKVELRSSFWSHYFFSMTNGQLELPAKFAKIASVLKARERGHMAAALTCLPRVALAKLRNCRLRSRGLRNWPWSVGRMVFACRVTSGSRPRGFGCLDPAQKAQAKAGGQTRSGVWHAPPLLPAPSFGLVGS